MRISGYLVASTIVLTLNIIGVLSTPGYSLEKVSWRRTNNFNAHQPFTPKKKQSSPRRQTVPLSGPARCIWAQSIVSDYAFENVRAKSCEGSPYIFEGTRGGKAFTVQIDIDSGELLKVEKLPLVEQHSQPQ
jgi:hypothetical protein